MLPTDLAEQFPELQPHFLPAPNRQRDILHVFAADSLDSLTAAPSSALAVISAEASRAADDYRFDLAVRASASRLSAVCLAAGNARYSPTADHLARELDLALFRAPDGIDAAELAVDLYRSREGGVLERTRRVEAVSELLDATGVTTEPDDLVASVSAQLGIPLDLEMGGATGGGLPVTSPDETPIAIVWPGDTLIGDLERLALHRLADVIQEIMTAPARNTRLSDAARADVLGELLVADAATARRLVGRLRREAIPMDGWHHVVRLEPSNLGETISADGEAARYSAEQSIASIALDTARTHARTAAWNRATAATAIVLVRSEAGHSRPSESRYLDSVLAQVLNAVQTWLPGLEFAIGIGSGHLGVAGIRASAVEAATALIASRADPLPSHAVHFDGLGVRRTLLQWYAIDDVREAVDGLLAPLDDLPPAKAAAAIETLNAYLDNESNITQTAAALRVHRNTVQYRIDQLVKRLDLDLGDAEQRLLLQLACRVHR